MIKSKFKLSYIIFSLIGGIGFSLIGFLLLSNTQKLESPSLISLILGGVFGLSGMYILFLLIVSDRFVIDNKQLMIKSIFGFNKKTIRLSEIISYNEIVKENKHDAWKDLTIYTTKSKHKISSGIISNYKELKRVLISGKSRNIKSEKFWLYKTDRNFGIGCIIFGLLFFFCMINIYIKKDVKILPEQITTLNGVSIDEAILDQSGKNLPAINIKLKEYPSFIFKISGIAYQAANSQNFLKNVKKDDSIELDVLTDSYKAKLIKDKKRNHEDNPKDYTFVLVYGLRDSNYSYLNYNDINLEHYKDSTSWGFWLLLIMSISTIFYGLITLIKVKKPAANTI